MRIVAVGECTRDRYIDLGVERVGGISLNFAINARRVGASHVALVSCVGTDAAGEAVSARLAREGIDASHVYQLPGATASQTIHLIAGGERVFPPGGFDPGVLSDFRLSDADLAFIGGCEIVAIPVFGQLEHLVEPLLFDRQWLRQSRSNRSPKTAGVPARDTLPLLVADLLDGADLGDDLASLELHFDAFDLIFVSGDESTVAQLRPYAERSRALLVVTHGAAGSSALVGGARICAPAEPVALEELVDSTGCGDAFQAAFTVDYFRHRDVPRALAAGAARASQVIRHLGATLDDG